MDGCDSGDDGVEEVLRCRMNMLEVGVMWKVG